MSKILYIKANPKNVQESRTFRLAEHFIQSYRAVHPEDQITTIDLYEEKIKPLSSEDIASIHNPTGQGQQNHPILKYAVQFKEADKYIIAAPLWNLGVPSILKAYIDYIMIVGITFRYGETGPIGLCQGKKAVHITSRGGDYVTGPYTAYEMADRYLRTIFGFLGITDFTTIAAEGLDIQGVNVEAVMAQAFKKAEEVAKAF